MSNRTIGSYGPPTQTEYANNQMSNGNYTGALANYAGATWEGAKDFGSFIGTENGSRLLSGVVSGATGYLNYQTAKEQNGIARDTLAFNKEQFQQSRQTFMEDRSLKMQRQKNISKDFINANGGQKDKLDKVDSDFNVKTERDAVNNGGSYNRDIRG